MTVTDSPDMKFTYPARWLCGNEAHGNVERKEEVEGYRDEAAQLRTYSA